LSRLAEIQEKLLETNQAIAKLEEAIARDPKSFSLFAMMNSLNKRYLDLEVSFENEVDNLGIDVCSYRVFGENNQPSIKGLSAVLTDFQSLVTTVYDAVKSAIPKIRSRVSNEIYAETEFRFGYTFPGSVGVVLTIPNERRLVGESYLDESLNAISNMSKVQQPSEVLEYAKKLGPAAVRAMYKWAYDHAESGLGVDIQWRRQQIIRSRLFTQKPEFEKLHHTISVTSEEQVTEDKSYITLVGADIARQSFHIRLTDGNEIRGKLEVPLSDKQTIELPKRYLATIIKTQKISYSTEEEITSYRLVNLEPQE